jgi:MerR family transcriptional regulator, thiopeptide resistance regulator
MATRSDPETGLRVGELAHATGLTVRTLHYYEEIGLLVASERSAAGHRRYGEADVARLYRICLLRRLGLSLDDIARALDDPKWSLRAAMTTHLAELDRRIEAGTRLRGRLSRLVGPAGAAGEHLTDDLLEVLVYADLEAAHEFLERVFGLGPGQLTRSDDGTVVHGELQAGDGVVWLHPESEAFGLSSPRRVGATTATMAVMVGDVDAHYRHAQSEGAQIDYEPVDQPYGYREYSARDSEGHLWSFMKPLD